MDLFEKIGKTATDTYKFTADKTSKLAKIAKLKMNLNEKKSIIEEEYENIGKKVYEKHIREENISIKEDLNEECKKIDILSSEIQEIRNEILKLNEKKQCKNCFTEIEDEFSYCPICGKKQENTKTRDEKIIEILEDSTVKKENNQEKNIILDEKQDDIN